MSFFSLFNLRVTFIISLNAECELQELKHVHLTKQSCEDNWYVCIVSVYLFLPPVKGHYAHHCHAV